MMTFVSCINCGQLLGPLTGTAPAHYREVDPRVEGWVETADGWLCFGCGDGAKQLPLFEKENDAQDNSGVSALPQDSRCMD